MDFKVAGTRKGITALQMDIKIRGISLEIMRGALAQAKEGRSFILDRMEEAIQAPRGSISTFAPQLTSFKVPIDMIGAVIGPGGKMIRQIVSESGAEVNIEDDGTVVVAATSKESADKAIRAIKALTEQPELGKVYMSTVKKVTDFGAFVEFLPGREGLVHVSQLDHKRVEKPGDVVKVGDSVACRSRWPRSRWLRPGERPRPPRGPWGRCAGRGLPFPSIRRPPPFFPKPS